MKIIAESVSEFKSIEKILKKTNCPDFFNSFDFIEYKEDTLIAKVNSSTVEKNSESISLPSTMNIKSVCMQAINDSYVVTVLASIKTMNFKFECETSTCNISVDTCHNETQPEV